MANELVDLGSPLPEGGPFEEAVLRSVPLFAGVGPDALEVVQRAARLLTLEPDETVIQRWHSTRDFYVVLSGTVNILIDGQRARELGTGEFFGEFAALDWGAGFGYARTATVVASSPLRLLVLTSTSLQELLRRAPDVERAIRAAMRHRLPPLSLKTEEATRGSH